MSEPDYKIVKCTRPRSRAKRQGLLSEFKNWSALIKTLQADEALEYFGNRTQAYFHTVAVRSGFTIQIAKSNVGSILIWRVG